MNISRYIPRGSVLTDVHKLCTSVFKLGNVFLVMNIGPDKHKKAEERMYFSCSALSSY
jgi:hypothetical protein